MKKSVKCTVLCVLMVCCMVFSLPLTASAFDSYQMSINEPTCGDNQGYILVLVEAISTGERLVQCLSWTAFPVYTDNDVTYNATEMNITINSDNSIDFIIRSNGNFQTSVGFCRSYSGDIKRNRYWGVSRDAVGFTYSYTGISSSYNIIGYQVYGNVVVLSTPFGNSNTNIPFSVTWGDDAKSVSLMTELLAVLYDIYHADEEMIELLNSLISEVDTVEEFLSAIQKAQITTNDLLEDIEDKITKLYDEQYISNGWLRSIYEYLLNFKGESTFEEPSTESISDYNKAEDELVSGADDTSDIEQQIEDFEIDADSSSLIWGIIQGYLNQNELVFGLVVGVLCLGIIALILNR